MDDKKDHLLAGTRVLDFTIAMAGPLATQRLAELGAEVIKVEVPHTGDLTRVFAVGGAKVDGSGAAYFALNHNKRSICVDLKSEAGQKVIAQLVRQCDVVIQNFRPGVAERLGIDYPALAAIRPDIVYASISGYGEDGPLVDAPGQDLLVQSFSGLTFNAGTYGDAPHQSPVFMIDTTASHLATSGILAALVQRGRTGRGDHVKVSLLGAALEMQSQELAAYSLNGRTNSRTNARYANVWLDPPYGIFRTRDGWIAFAQNDLSVMAEVFASDALAALAPRQSESGGPANSDEWRAWREEVFCVLEAEIAKWQTDALVESMSAARIWCGPVNDYDALTSHPQARRYLEKVTLADGREVIVPRNAIIAENATTPPFRHPPGLGADTEAVLQELGLSAQEIAEHRASGVIG